MTCTTKMLEKKYFSLLVNDNEQGQSGGSREKLIKSLLRGRMIFFYHVNRIFAVCLLSVIFTQQNCNFQGEIAPKNSIFGPNVRPPLMPSTGFC